jgi:hypothetical protein
MDRLSQTVRAAAAFGQLVLLALATVVFLAVTRGVHGDWSPYEY